MSDVEIEVPIYKSLFGTTKFRRPVESRDVSVNDILKLFSSLGISVKDLVSYKYLYGEGANKYTFGHVGSSVWYCTYYPHDKSIEINSTYFEYPTGVDEYNEKIRISRRENVWDWFRWWGI